MPSPEWFKLKVNTPVQLPKDLDGIMAVIENSAAPYVQRGMSKEAAITKALEADPASYAAWKKAQARVAFRAQAGLD